MSAGSSPLTRGTLSASLTAEKSLPVHPRLRGELAYLKVIAGVPNGSSPLTRGTPVRLCAKYPFLRFIPAYAGNSGFQFGNGRLTSVHPRLRGELIQRSMAILITTGSSPLTRGTHLAVDLKE